MKFDVLEALRIAEYEIGHSVDIKCMKDGPSFTIQMKVLVGTNQIYGQQFAFMDQPTYTDEWYIMNEKFRSAVASLKLQIEGDQSDNDSSK